MYIPFTSYKRSLVYIVFVLLRTVTQMDCAFKEWFINNAVPKESCYISINRMNLNKIDKYHSDFKVDSEW